MSRVEENDQTLKNAAENIGRVYKIAEENIFSDECIADLIAKIAVIGLLSDISRSLTVIADKESGNESK